MPVWQGLFPHVVNVQWVLPCRDMQRDTPCTGCWPRQGAWPVTHHHINELGGGNHYCSLILWGLHPDLEHTPKASTTFPVNQMDFCLGPTTCTGQGPQHCTTCTGQGPQHCTTCTGHRATATSGIPNCCSGNSLRSKAHMFFQSLSPNQLALASADSTKEILVNTSQMCLAGTHKVASASVANWAPDGQGGCHQVQQVIPLEAVYRSLLQPMWSRLFSGWSISQKKRKCLWAPPRAFQHWVCTCRSPPCEGCHCGHQGGVLLTACQTLLRWAGSLPTIYPVGRGPLRWRFQPGKVITWMANYRARARNSRNILIDVWLALRTGNSSGLRDSGECLQVGLYI